MVGLETQDVIERFVTARFGTPMQQKTKDGRTIYRAHTRFFAPIESSFTLPKIADFGSARRGDTGEHLTVPCQPHAYRAPEVLVGMGWTYSADIFNLGTLVCLYFYFLYDVHAKSILNTALEHDGGARPV